MDATHKISKNLGGDRLGSGNRMNVNMHAYNRSTHDLSRAWRSSMNVGTLVPCFCEPALPGDTFSINLSEIVRTMPAVGPLYGSFKLQVDFFQCPVRLYNGLLHNNMQKVGLNMADVKLPKMILETKVKNWKTTPYEINNSQIATDSLLNYLGLNGIAGVEMNTTDASKTIARKFPCVPLLAYYEIVKNYYANKQEEEFSVIAPVEMATAGYFGRIIANNEEEQAMDVRFLTADQSTPLTTITGNTYQQTDGDALISQYLNYALQGTQEVNIDNFQFVIQKNTSTTDIVAVDLYTLFPTAVVNEQGVRLGSPSLTYAPGLGYAWYIRGVGYDLANNYVQEIGIDRYPLIEIDDMRIEILKATGLGNELIINTLPLNYIKNAIGQTPQGMNRAKFSQCGLALKTYQSDVMNNWLQTEWIDGTNGISEITAIDTSSGSFTIDALNLAQKVYNMLNRIAVSGGSYEDYIEAVYSTEALRRAETPFYIGGMSSEIVFEEVVSTAASGDDVLGSLAGKGKTAGQRGGHIECKVQEPSFIMGIVSITPRVDYSQGNKWWATELDTMDDFHKPALDAIGFQDLLLERGAWWGTYFDQNGQLVKMAGGKSPAWIEYMTAVNETHGDFADKNKTMFMTLNRQYEFQTNFAGTRMMPRVGDFTTYIDPRKYNYAFADTSLAAQNFWVQLGIECISRRVMSAKVIPSL